MEKGSPLRNHGEFANSGGEAESPHPYEFREWFSAMEPIFPAIPKGFCANRLRLSLFLGHCVVEKCQWGQRLKQLYGLRNGRQLHENSSTPTMRVTLRFNPASRLRLGNLR
jgi:hypothetical protein